ncbi:keratin-associated protein 6-2-like [Harpegnathos saltator]|uniref:keratin-associated protein 6-2-like n=1 Tax=Harpegnathos saltator TaxID=610380 RepID=UPI000DBEF270|nr:keratin-associated protein 6-2-like [Harpegnathos saltator]
MNALLLLTVLCLALPIYGQGTQVTKRQDKRGVLGLGYGALGHGGIGLQGNLATAGAGYGGYGHGYLGSGATYSLGHAAVAPAYSQNYGAPAISHGHNAPLYTSYRLASAGHGAGLGYGAGYGSGLAYGAGHGTGLAYGAGYGAGYGVGHGAGVGAGFGGGYGHGGYGW